MKVPDRYYTALWVEYWKGKHLVLELPSTFEEFYASVDKDIRTQCNKAKRNGLYARWDTKAANDDIADIWHSKGERWGKPVRHSITHMDPDIGTFQIEDTWPFSYYAETLGYHDLIQCYNSDGTVVAYAEFASTPEDSVAFSCMGHADWLPCGAMKLTFVEAIRGFIARGTKNVYYQKPNGLIEEPVRTTFMKDFGFKVKT